MMLSKMIYKLATSAWTMPGLSVVFGYLSARRLLADAPVQHERLSLTDNTLLSGYAENIQRNELALSYCRNKRVLDAGCGTGYGSHFLASHGAASVFGVDISAEAIDEARQHYVLDNLRFEQRDVQALDDPALHGRFDVVVNFETLSHLREPEKFLGGALKALAPGGTLVVSTPNAQVVEMDADGKPNYRYQFKAYTPDDLQAFLKPHFREVTLYGHVLTHEGMLRKKRSRELFDQLCETYYNPINRVGRAIKQVAGKKVLGPPSYAGVADSFSGDYAIVPLREARFGWPATTLIAVCTT